VDLYPLDDEIARLEVELADQGAAPRLRTVVGLSWGLRQRDSRRALELADDADRIAAARIIPLQPDAVCMRTDLVRAEVWALMGEYGRAEEALALALRTCGTLDDPVATGDAAMVEAVVAHAQAQRDRYMAAWQRAAGHYGQAGDALCQSLARGWLAFLSAHADRAHSAAQVAALRAEFPAPRHAALEALLHAADGMLGFAGDVAACSVAAHKASLYARECGLVRHAIVSSVNAGTAMQNLADYEGAAQCYDWAAVEARKTGWTALIGSTLMRLASLHRELDQLEASEQVFREALAALAHSPGGISKAEAHAGLATTLLRQGRAREAVELFRTAVELFSAESSVDGLAVNLVVLARALAQCGEHVEAQAVLARAEEMVERLEVVRLRVELNETRAELHECEALPAPEGMTSKQAAVHFLEASLAAGQALEGWQPSSRLLLRLGRAWGAAGDAMRSFRYAEQAYRTLHRENLRRATNAAAVMRARSELERERAEMAHQRELIAALEQASLTDTLTGLRNRRFLQQHLDHDVAQALRRYEGARDQEVPEADLLFFLVDIDHFKQVNDTHGHAAGDAVLVQMRERLREVFRESDYLVRWGGEEFLIVAREFSRDAAAQLAERIRAAVAARPFRIDAHLQLPKTCSIGFAALPFLARQPEAIGWQEVVDIADAGLYLAKRHGRDAWVGLAAVPGAAPEGYPRRIKDDALALLQRAELACESSLAQLRTSAAVRVRSDPGGVPADQATS
jgi:diguanylate cyclase (GGDEF)-like protein